MRALPYKTASALTRCDFLKKLLAAAAIRCVAVPEDWLEAAVDQAPQRFPLRDARFELRFAPDWTDGPLTDLTLTADTWSRGLFPQVQFGDSTLSTFAWTIWSRRVDARLTRRALQEWAVPGDYVSLWQEYERRRADFATTQAEYFKALDALDRTVYRVFGVTDTDAQHIRTRLARFPLNQFQPRRPWEIGLGHTAIQYDADRFA